jgi:3-hydroxybutyryl-CoA dehydrogenase
MGAGIVEVCARAGYTTVVREVNDALLARGLERVRGSLAKAVERGKLEQGTMEATLARLKGTTSLADLGDCDLVIEAAIENMAEKRLVFTALDAACPPATIFASNTSSLPIIEMAAATKRPDRVVGLHFFNPAPVMKLVELVRTIASSDETVATARAFGQSLGKTVVLAKDSPGFIVNLLLIPFLLDAVRALENGVASREDIDQGMVLGCGHPQGPLALLDLIGIDTTYYIANIMFDEFKDARYAPPPLMKRLVLAGHFGRKTGKGFYDYGK